MYQDEISDYGWHQLYILTTRLVHPDKTQKIRVYINLTKFRLKQMSLDPTNPNNRKCLKKLKPKL